MSLSQEIEYTEEVSRVTSVKMGILSPQRILEQSVCEVYNHITSPDQVEGTLFDPRMGSSNRTKVNALSKLKMMYDPGHFGHINLAKPVIQYQFLNQIVATLNSVCHACSSILIDKSNKDTIKRLMGKTRKARFGLLDKMRTVDKVKACPNCGACIVKFSKDKEGVGRITMKKTIVQLPGDVTECLKDLDIGVIDDEEEDEPKTKSEKKEVRRFVDPEVALNILQNVTDEDCELMGYNRETCRPDWMIWTIMPVPPPSMRPAVQTEAGQTSDDDLTHKLNDIIKTNNQIRNLLEENDPNKTKFINQWWELLQYHVVTYINNEIKPNAVNRSGRPYKTLRQRIEAKEGRVRSNLMGKRVDGSARTVITPDPNISIDEIGVPMEIMTNLTFPEVVTTFNQVELTQLVRNGPKWPGAKCIKYRNTSSVEQKLGRCPPSSRYRSVLKYLSQEQRDNIILRPGDIVYRHLLEGDWVLFNRQPSLHKMSMMGHRVKARSARSFGMNINVTTPYGADFDGDEMNVHVCRNLQSLYELKRLASVSTQIVSPQASRPVMGLVQDSLLGMYMITKESRADYHPMNLMNLMHLTGWMSTYQGTLPQSTSKEDGVLKWNGQAVISSYFPKISYLRESDDNRLLIQNGRIISGYFDSASFGAKAGSVVHVTWNDYGPEATRRLFDNTMNTSCQWLLINGFSVGLMDTYITPKDHYQIRDKIKVKLVEAKLKIDFLHKGWYPILGEELQTEFNQRLRLAVGYDVPEDQERFLDTGQPIDVQFEMDILTCLDKARSIAEKETNKKLQQTAEAEGRSNCMESMVSSGSKGSKTNLVQIVSLLGQQSIEGGRVPEDLHRRTLPHFYKDNLTPEARGFIESSYEKGLTPTEYAFHTMAGRIGVISTSIKTAETGYLQRRLTKILEDAKVCYDGTVRTANDMVIEHTYGQDGFDGSKIEPTRFDYLDMHHSEFQRVYQFMPDDNLKALLSPEAYNEMINIPDWEDILQHEFTQISNDRDLLKFQIWRNGIPEKIYSPVNFKRLIKNYRYHFHLTHAPVATVNPVYVITKVDSLIKEFMAEDKTVEAVEENFIVLVSTIRNHMASKKIIREKYTQEAFDFLLEEIRKQYYQALVTPGEMVGVIAAQSIGEPSTQLTLDTFHKTGIGSGANVSRGVPRLNEILRVAQTLATPALEVHLNQEYLKSGKVAAESNSPEEKQMAYSRAEEIAADLEYTVMQDIVNNVQIIFDASDCPSDVIGDQAFIDSYYEFMPEDECRPPDANAPWLLRIMFREKELHKRGISLLDVEASIKASQDKFKDLANISCLFSDDNAEQLICRVRVAEGVLNNENPVNIMRLLEKMLLGVRIKGIDNIITARVRLVEPIDVYRSDGTIGKTYDYLIDTAGVNLIEVFNAPYVDYTKTLSNHIYEIMEVLGISAARDMVLKEINDVLKFAGTYVNPRHIELLADVMCREGFLISVDRHGITKLGSGPWARASFEETTNQLYSAASYGEEDPMTGVSANIMFGQPFLGGTNSFDISLDENMLETSEIPEIAHFRDMTDPPKEIETPGYCDFKDDNFTFQL